MATSKTENKRSAFFGLDGDTLLQRLEKKRIVVMLSNGETLAGVLVGASPYTVTLLAADKVPTIVNKGHIVTLAPAPNGANGDE